MSRGDDDAHRSDHDRTEPPDRDVQDDRNASTDRGESERGEPGRADRGRGPAGSGVGNVSRWPWIVSIGLVVVLVGLYFVWPGYEWVIDRTYSLVRQGEQRELRDWVQDFGVWGPVLILTLMLAQTLLPVIPSILVMVVSVLAYGAWWGAALAWVGLMASATVAYAIGRALGTGVVDRIVGERAERRIGGYVRRHGTLAVLAARVSPALSTDAVSYAAGIVRMQPLRFLAATGMGIVPLLVAIGWLGADVDRPGSGLLWISIVSIAAFVAWVVVDRVRHGRPEGATRSGT